MTWRESQGTACVKNPFGTTNIQSRVFLHEVHGVVLGGLERHRCITDGRARLVNRIPAVEIAIEGNLAREWVGVRLDVVLAHHVGHVAVGVEHAVPGSNGIEDAQRVGGVLHRGADRAVGVVGHRRRADGDDRRRYLHLKRLVPVAVGRDGDRDLTQAVLAIHGAVDLTRKDIRLGVGPIALDGMHRELWPAKISDLTSLTSMYSPMGSEYVM